MIRTEPSFAPKFKNNRKKTKGRKYSFTPLKRVAVVNNKGVSVDVKVMNDLMLNANKDLIAEAGKKVVNKLSVTNTSRKIYQ